jgi:hypothetical protein
MPVHDTHALSQAASVQSWHLLLLGLQPHGTEQCATAQSRYAPQHAAHEELNGSRCCTHLAVQSPPCKEHASRHSVTSGRRCSILSLQA